jgi:SAM-dependent methyltransferase
MLEKAMRGLSVQTLHIYEEPLTGSGEKRALDVLAAPATTETNRAEQLACLETWRSFPPRRPTATYEPYTLDWFKQIEQRRYSRHGYWIPKVLECHRHQGEQVLGLGDGLGTDWIQYAAHGAEVHYATPSSEALAVVRKHFSLRRLPAQLHHASLTALPLSDECLDVVCLSTLSTGLAAPLEAIVGEIFRVLKPGGKVIAAVPAKYDARWWQDFWFPWNRWLEARRPERTGHWSGRELSNVFGRFSLDKLQKRHLRRSDLPHIWRWMLLPCLERIMGRFLVLKAFKPLTASIRMVAVA